MTFINPLATSILQSAQVQQQAAVDRSRQVRQKQVSTRNVGALSDRLEHEVENVEEPPVAEDEGQKQRQSGKRRRQPKAPPPGAADERPHLDVTG